MNKINGTVIWFNEAKGYGFIKAESGMDVFVHFASITGEGYQWLADNEKVSFEVVDGPKGPQASNVVRSLDKLKFYISFQGKPFRKRTTKGFEVEADISDLLRSSKAKALDYIKANKIREASDFKIHGYKVSHVTKFATIDGKEESITFRAMFPDFTKEI